MGSESVLDLLYRRRQYHEIEINGINAAIEAYKKFHNNAPALKQSIAPSGKRITMAKEQPKIPWTSEIAKSYVVGETLDIGQTCQRMAERGIKEALDPRNRATVSSILARMASQDIWPIIKVEPGRYKKIDKELIEKEAATKEDANNTKPSSLF